MTSSTTPQDGQSTRRGWLAAAACVVGLVVALVALLESAQFMRNNFLRPTDDFTAHVCDVTPVEQGENHTYRYHIRTSDGRITALASQWAIEVQYLTAEPDVHTGKVVATVLHMPERHGQPFRFTVERNESAPGVHNLVMLEQVPDDGQGSAQCAGR